MQELLLISIYLTKPGGRVVITIPNYGGMYGSLESYFSPEILGMHNLRLMSCQALIQLISGRVACEVTACRTGRLSPWILNFEKEWSVKLAKASSFTLNAPRPVQPFDIGPLCPLFVLTMKKRVAS
jgi:hypothetical protein